MSQNTYQLSNQKLSAPSSSRGLKAGSIRAGGGATLATARINPGAGQVKFMPAKIPQAVEDQTSAGIQHFMGTMSEAAFRYDERESTHFAKEAVNRYTTKVSELYSGSLQPNGKYSKGYSSTTGNPAVLGYSGYDEQLSKLFDEEMGALEPRVRQKAMFDMASVKESFKDEGAKHRLKQQTAVEEQEKYKSIKRTATLMAQAPDSIYTPDASGMTLKQKLYAEFDTPEEADKAWYSLVKDVNEGIYWDTFNRVISEGGDQNAAAIAANDKARDYAVRVSSKELAGDVGLGLENDLRSKLQVWNNQAAAAKSDNILAGIAADEAQIEKDERLAIEQLRQLQVDHLERTEKALKEGLPPPGPTLSKQEFANRYAGILSDTPYKSHWNTMFDPQSERGSDEMYLKASDNTGGWSSEDEIFYKNTLNTSEFSDLRNLDRLKKKENLTLKIADGETYVNDILFAVGEIEKSYEGLTSLSVSEKRDLNRLANKQMSNCIAAEGGDMCYAQVELNYSTVKPSTSSLRPFDVEGSVTRPANDTEFKALNQRLTLQLMQFKVQPEPYQRSAEGKTERAYLDAQIQSLKLWQTYLKQVEAFKTKYGRNP